MKLLADFFPVILFFIAFKLFDIYIATATAMAASILQVLAYRWKNKRFETNQLLTLLLITVLGGATLLLQNELFIKWKPTAVNWAFALVFLSSQFIGKKNLIQRMLEKNIQLPPNIWQRLNFSWSLFFLLMGFANLYVVYHFDTNAWVHFKVFGILGLTLVFVALQAIFLAKHVKENE